MALSVSVSSSAAAFAPRHGLPSATPAPSRLLRAARAFSTGYAASFYGGAASATRTRGRDDEEVGDEDGSSSGFGGMSASEAAMALEEREMYGAGGARDAALPARPPPVRDHGRAPPRHVRGGAPRPHPALRGVVPLNPQIPCLILGTPTDSGEWGSDSPETLLVAGGAMYVEVFNRGVIPLAYSIRKRNSRTGLPFTYYDGIYLLWTYFTKPESVDALQMKLNADDDVIRSTSFKVRKRRVY
uniref:30S ribosomal protein S6 alpha, chloroplastic n=1 Tax=Aegilops tauschii TaxID=37682 RepID=M8CCH7_AEGTA